MTTDLVGPTLTEQGEQAVRWVKRVPSACRLQLWLSVPALLLMLHGGHGGLLGHCCA